MHKMNDQKSGKAIIFDLDGTLADSITVGIDIVNELKVIQRPLTREDYERAKNLTIPAILKEFGVPLWRAPHILMKGRAALTKRIHEIPFFEGMDEAIYELAKDYRLFVMSSNSLVNVQKFLELHKVREPFEQIYGGAGIFSKAKVLNRVVKQHALDRQQTYYVGDEVRDVVAAKKAGLKSISVTWGFNGEQILSTQNPDHIVHTPQELQAIFTKEQQ